jgi:hypothetical protein
MFVVILICGMEYILHNYPGYLRDVTGNGIVGGNKKSEAAHQPNFPVVVAVVSGMDNYAVL